MKERIADISRIVYFALAALILSAAIPAARADESNAAKAQALVNAAIDMTDSNAAVKLLWQATEIDPSLIGAYVYLGAYYNSRSDFENMIKVFKKQAANVPAQAVSAYLNIGEAYQSMSPPRFADALVYYRKAFALDPKNSFAALRIGEVLAQQGSRDEAVRFLRLALASGAAHPTIVTEAKRDLAQLAAK
ncbi:MAG: tetratricopeptide repeat protein [Candidatus Binataceae bacterium]